MALSVAAAAKSPILSPLGFYRDKPIYLVLSALYYGLKPDGLKGGTPLYCIILYNPPTPSVVVIDCFKQEHGPLSSPSPREESLLLFTSKMGCLADERSFVLDATAFVGRPPPEQQVESVGWSFSQDQRGNSGLIGFGSSESKATVSFELPCGGPRRVLDIGYLLSYIGMGAAKVVVSRLDPNGGSDKDSKEVDGVVSGEDDSSDDVVVVIDGLWDSRASVQGNEVIPLPDGFDSIRVTFEVLSADTETLYARFLSDSNTRESGNIRRNRKFKVARMQCC